MTGPETTDEEIRILDALHEDGGFTTGEVAKRTSISFGHSTRTSSSYVRLLLLRLQKRGLVSTLDDQKPICWTRTSSGTVELKKAYAECLTN